MSIRCNPAVRACATVSVLLCLAAVSLPAAARVHSVNPWQTLTLPVDPDGDPEYDRASAQDVAIDGDSLIVVFQYIAKQEAVLYRRDADDEWTRSAVLASAPRTSASPPPVLTVVMKNRIAVFVIDGVPQIWEQSGGTWTRSALSATGLRGGFAISGQRILAGRRDCAAGSDAVVLEKNSNNTWVITGQINGAAGQCTTSTVDLELNYDHALIRSKTDIVRAYRRNGTNLAWTAAGSFTLPQAVGDHRGPVALQLATAVTPGSAVFRRSGSTWTPSGTVKPIDYAMGTGNAWSVLYRDRVLITQERDGNPLGRVEPQFYAYVESSPGRFEHVATLGHYVGTGTIDLSHRWAVSSTMDLFGGPLLAVWRLPDPIQAPEAIPNSFEQRDLSGFEFSGGYHSVASSNGNEFLRQTSTAGLSSAVITGSNWPDYQRLHVEITPNVFGSGDTWVGAAVRYVDADNFYYVSLRHSNLLQLRKRVAGIETILDEAPLTATPGRRVTMNISVDGRTLSATVGDARLEGEDDSLDVGRAALLTQRARAYFDNVVASPTSSYGAYLRLFGDQYDYGADFSTVGGHWEQLYHEGQQMYLMSQTDTTGTALAVNGVPMTDQQVSGNIYLDRYAPTSTAVAWFGLVARYVDARNFYYLSVRSSGQVHIRKIVNGVTTTLAAGTYTATPGERHRYQLTVIGDELHAFIDGARVATAYDDDIPRGIYGMATYRTAATWSMFNALQP